MTSLRLYKSEKLCAPTAIDRLFARSRPEGAMPCRSAMAYPWRAVWSLDPSRRPGEGAVVKFLISVPKKRLRLAVDRVTMRRRCREAYRLNRDLLPEGAVADVAFVYVASELTPYARTEASVRRILEKVARSLSPEADQPQSPNTDATL